MATACGPRWSRSRRRRGRQADRQRGYRHPRRRGGAAGRRAGHRRRSSPIIICPKRELPPALAVLNPNRPDCPYPEKNLCGAGVAFKLAQALLATPGLAAGEAAARGGIVPETGGHRHGGGRGAAHRREPHHREARPGRACASAQSGSARAARRGRLHRRERAQRAPGGLPDRAAHQRRRPHGYGPSRDGAVPHRRPGARPRPGATASRAECRAPAGGGRNPRHLRAHAGGRSRRRPGLLCRRLASRRAGHRGQPPGGAPAPPGVRARARIPRTVWRKDPAAAFRPSTCSKRWNPWPTCSCASAATNTPRA